MTMSCQEMYEHSVPLVKEWPDSLHEFRDELNQWEIDAMEKEISLYQNGVKVGDAVEHHFAVASCPQKLHFQCQVSTLESFLACGFGDG